MDEGSRPRLEVQPDHVNQHLVKSGGKTAGDEEGSQQHQAVPTVRDGAEAMVVMDVAAGAESGDLMDGNGSHHAESIRGAGGVEGVKPPAVVMNGGGEGGSGVVGAKAGEDESKESLPDHAEPTAMEVDDSRAGSLKEEEDAGRGGEEENGRSFDDVPTVKEESMGVHGPEPTMQEEEAGVVKAEGEDGNASAAEANGEEEGGLPAPCEPPSYLAPCLRGRLHVAADGRHVCKGVWAMKRSDHDLEGDALAAVTNKFEFSLTPPSAESPLPLDGTYKGFFWITLKRLVKYDDTCHLQFTPNSADGWNIMGSGRNQCGSYQISGTVGTAMNLELFRLFDHLVNKGKAPPKSRKSGSHKKASAPPRQSGDYNTRGGFNLDGASVVSAGGDSAVSHLTEGTGYGLHRGESLPTGSGAGLSPGPQQPDLQRGASIGSISVMGNAIGVSKAGRLIKTKVQLYTGPEDLPRPDRLTAKCLEIVGRLMKQPASYLFNEPVNPERDQCPDYYMVITRPMDFGTIKQKLECMEYSSPDAFAEDMRLVFQNAVRYNARPEHFVNKAAVTLSELFESRYSAVFPSAVDFGYDDDMAGESLAADNVQPMVARKSFGVGAGGGGGAVARAGKKRQRASDPMSELAGDFFDEDLPFDEEVGEVYYDELIDDSPSEQPRSAKKSRPSGGARRSGFGGGGGGGARKSIPAAGGDDQMTKALLQRIEALEKEVVKAKTEPKRTLTYEDKKNLSKCIESLPMDKASKVIKIIQSRMDLSVGAEEVEIDIDTLDNDTLLELQDFVNKCAQPRGRGRPPKGDADGKKRKTSAGGGWTNGDSDFDDSDDEYS